MTPQEQELITQLFGRLKESPTQPQDPEAAELIRRSAAQQADAPYKLVQTVLIQDMVLTQAQARIAELENRLGAGASQQGSSSRSFLPQVPAAGRASGTGPWGRATSPEPPAAQPGVRQAWESREPAAPPPAAAVPGAMAGAGSGFLRSAAATALGVAGGQLLFQGIESMFGQHAGGLLAGQSVQPALTETVVNNFYGDSNSAPPDADVADARSDGDNAGTDGDTTAADDDDPGFDSAADDANDDSDPV